MTEQMVVDASVVAKLYLRDEEYTDKTDLLFSRFNQGDIGLIAPLIITYEVPAAIKRGMARTRADETIWRAAIDNFENYILGTQGLIIVDDSGAKYEAMRLAISYRCGYYDALYLLLAEDLGGYFITADEKLWRKLHAQVPHLLFLGKL